MKLLCILLSCISGLMVLAAAFVYLVDSRQGQQLLRRLLQQLRVLFFILFAVYVASALVSAADSVSVFVGFLTLSVVAYFVREYRRPQREKKYGLGGAERTPVVPIVTRRSSGDDAEGGR
jgi:NADH:ubiquinone oxidoreductase subunit 2 (subunit N)